MGITYQRGGVLPLFADNVLRDIKIFGISAGGYYLFIATGFLAFFMFFIPLVSLKRNQALFWISAGMATVSFLVFLLAFIRNGILCGLFLSLVYFNYMIKRITAGRLVLLGFLVAVLIMVSSFYKFKSIGNLAEKVDLADERIFKVALEIPYSYVANNLWNLDHALNPETYQHRHNTTYGFTLVAPFFQLFNIPDNWANMYRESMDLEGFGHEHSIKISGYNTVAYQWTLYKDFGILGTLLLPCILGIFIYILYLKVKIAPNVANVSLYSFVAFGIF
jgi:oligosaccharide repeat unit polymerase